MKDIRDASEQYQKNGTKKSDIQKPHHEEREECGTRKEIQGRGDTRTLGYLDPGTSKWEKRGDPTQGTEGTQPYSTLQSKNFHH